MSSSPMPRRRYPAGGSGSQVSVELAADPLTEARKLVSGVILTAAEEDLSVLAPLLAVVA